MAIACYAVAVFSAPTEVAEEPLHPYNFAFEEKDVNFTVTRQEEMDAQGVVKGSYSYIDKDGIFRTVNYIADNDGFRASIQSNEPGLTNSAPAGTTFQIN